MEVLTYLSFALLVALVFTVPGWLCLRRAGVDPLFAVYLGPAAGALAAAAIVALGVVLPWSVTTTCIAGAGLMAVITVLCLLGAPRPLLPPRRDLAGVAVFLLAFLSMTAFSGVPSHPYANWTSDTVGPGRVDSPRWPGLPSDNTLPYRTGQVALYKEGGANTRNDYAVGWWISDRTPLTGLDFAFAAATFGVHVSRGNVQQIPTPMAQMRLTDRFGFWAYQVVAMFLNLAIILGVYLLARTWFEARVALVAALVAAVMPGLFLNAVYTWPKQAIGYFVLAGAATALRRRPVLTGALAALGYLTHPAGVVWVPALAILLLAEVRERRWRALARFVIPAAVLVAPWEFFTSQIMHAVSRWTTAPLGYLMTDPTQLGSQLSKAWHVFLSNGLLFAVWTRLQSTAASFFPVDLNDTPAYLVGRGGFNPSIMSQWTTLHGFAVWGMAGLVLFPFILFWTIRAWPRFRRLGLWFVLPALAVAELANGFGYPFANQSMFTLVGLLAVVAAYGLTRSSRRVRIVLVAFGAFELLTMVWGGLYRPFDIDPVSAVVLTLIAAVGQLALLACLALSLDLVEPGRLVRWPLRNRVQPARAA
jgi:hypothetical protein